ncbi:MAG: TetR/AcrR family transcriptional regulator [Actinomycetota bacterium]
MTESGDETPRPERRGDLTRRRLFEAAEEIFTRLGYHAASILSITQTATAGLGTFYLYFPTKLHIFAFLLQKRRDQWTEETLRAAEGAPDEHVAVQRALAAHFNWIAQRPHLLPLFREAQFIDPSLVTELYLEPAKKLAERLSRSVETGTAPRTDPEVLAWFLIAAAEFATLSCITWRDVDDVDEDRYATFLGVATQALGLGTTPGTR